MLAALRAAPLSASLMADWACAHARFASQPPRGEWGCARGLNSKTRLTHAVRSAYFLGLSAEDMFSRMAVSA